MEGHPLRGCLFQRHSASEIQACSLSWGNDPENLSLEAKRPAVALCGCWRGVLLVARHDAPNARLDLFQPCVEFPDRFHQVPPAAAADCGSHRGARLAR